MPIQQAAIKRSLLGSLRGILSEVQWASEATSGLGSFVRTTCDAALYRGLYFGHLPGEDHERSIRLKNDIEITYRLNRGDIQGIREVWQEECYRPPVEVPVDVVVDLGANIGLTSLWYAKRCGASRIVCVEPVPRNAELARRNLRANGLHAEVLEAAVGPTDGCGSFEDARDSNLGSLAETGRRVSVVSMETVLGRLPQGESVDLLKVDIEGAEGPLLLGAGAWLDRVEAMIVEFHPGRVNVADLVAAVKARRFSHVPAGAKRFNSMDFFFRKSVTS